MSDVFTASNGYEVRTDCDGDVRIITACGWDFNKSLDDGDLTALREFFQHERDKELGRWRWPEHPEYVVYPHQRWLEIDLINVVNETYGGQYTFERNQRGPDSFLPGSPTAAAQAYFEAHPVPEPKLWENAQPGEVWAVKYYDRDVEYPYMVPEDGWGLIVRSARRIWPEEEQE